MNFDIQKLIEVLGVNVQLLLVLVVMMALDIIAGCTRAIVEHDFQSKIFREGLAKKLYELMLIVVAYLVDYTLGTKVVGIAVTSMLIGAEAYSIVFENAAHFISIPGVLEDAINSLRQEKVKEEEEADNGQRL